MQGLTEARKGCISPGTGVTGPVISHPKKRVLETGPDSSARAGSFLPEPSLQLLEFDFNMW